MPSLFRKLLGGDPLPPAHLAEPLAELKQLAAQRPTLAQSFDLLARALRKHSLPVVRLSSDELMAQVATDLKYPTLDALYVAIGEGHVSPQSITTLLRLAVIRVEVCMRCCGVCGSI